MNSKIYVTLCLCAVSVAAQDSPHGEWERLIAAGRTAMDAGIYADAQRFYTAALQLAESAGRRDRRLARSLAEMGSLRSTLGDCEAGLDLGLRAVRLYETLPDVPPAEAAHAWLNLARSYFCRAHFSNAEHALRKALAFEESAPAPHPGRIAEILASLAAACLERHNAAAATDAAARAEAILRTSPETDLRTRALLLNNLGSIYHRSGRMVEAERTLAQALAVAQTIPGEHDLSMFYVLTNLGSVDFSRSRYADAIARFEQALALIDSGAALPDFEIARFLRSYALCLTKVGRKSDARRITARAAALQRQRRDSAPAPWTVSVTELTQKGRSK